MKKAFFLFASLLLITALLPGARAAEMIPYYVAGIDISIPETYRAFTRGAELDDEIMRYMEEEGVYLEAWDAEGEAVRMTIKDLEIENPPLLDDREIQEWIPYFEEQIKSKNIGVIVEKSEAYHHNQTEFHRIHFHFPSPHGVRYIIQYNTIIFKKWISIEMNSGTGPISPEQEAESEEIIDSVYILARFFSDPAGYTDAFQYVDPVTGAEFTVPENWSQEPLLEQKEHPYVIFYLNSDPYVFVLYQGRDLWSEISEQERWGKTRTDMEYPYKSVRNGVADTLDISPDEVFRKQYGKMEYEVGRTSEKKFNEDREAENVGYTTLLAGFDNGYAYYFYFTGWEDHENYKDLEAMLSSMKYPGMSDGGAGSSEAVKWIGLFFIAFLAVLSAGIILYGHARARRQSAGRPKNCRFCGARLPGKGEFCPACGTRIEE